MCEKGVICPGYPPPSKPAFRNANSLSTTESSSAIPSNVPNVSQTQPISLRGFIYHGAPVPFISSLPEWLLESLAFPSVFSSIYLTYGTWRWLRTAPTLAPALWSSSQGSCQYMALQAAASANNAGQKSDPHMIVKPRRQHGLALRATKTTLPDRGTVVEDVKLFTVIILAIFEVRTCSRIREVHLTV